MKEKKDFDKLQKRYHREPIPVKIELKNGRFWAGEKSGRYIVDVFGAIDAVQGVEPFWSDIFVVDDIEKGFEEFVENYEMEYADAQDEDEDEATTAEPEPGTPEQRFKSQCVEAMANSGSDTYVTGLKVFLAAEELGLSPEIRWESNRMCIKTTICEIIIDDDGDIVDESGDWEDLLEIAGTYMNCDRFVAALRRYVSKKSESSPTPEQPTLLSSLKSALASGELTEKQVLGVLIENKEG